MLTVLIRLASFAALGTAALVWVLGCLALVICVVGAIVTAHPGFVVGGILAFAAMCAADLVGERL